MWLNQHEIRCHSQQRLFNCAWLLYKQKNANKRKLKSTKRKIKSTKKPKFEILTTLSCIVTFVTRQKIYHKIQLQNQRFFNSFNPYYWGSQTYIHISVWIKTSKKKNNWHLDHNVLGSSLFIGTKYHHGKKTLGTQSMDN